jgi:hypothetical protein
MIKDREKRIIAQRNRAESMVRALELAIARHTAQVDRMRPLIEAAQRWYASRVPSRNASPESALEVAIEAYRASKAGGR